MQLQGTAFGDSLTYGFPGYPGRPESRYTYWVQERVKNWSGEMEKNLEISFNVYGVPGELTGDFLQRFDHEVLGHNKLPHFVVLLGGSNDLGWGIAPERIFANLERIWAQILDREIGLIPCTIPPVRGENLGDQYTINKEELNAQIQDFSARREISVVDLYHGMQDATGSLDIRYDWGDGLHFSVAGYHRMGDLIFEQGILPLVNEQFKS